MSWQGNECFVFGIEYEHEDMEGRMLDAMSELLWLYGEHGSGWYLLGDSEARESEEDCFPFEFYEDGSWGFGWLPNPFMHPYVTAMKVNGPHDLMQAAFECYDSRNDVIAYAGDGDEPLERVEVYGEVYDMRESTTCATAA